MNVKVLKIISFGLTVVSVGVNLAASAISNKLLDHDIKTKVSEALTKKD